MLGDLLSPAMLMTQSFKQLTDALTGHFEPKPLVMAERYYFYQRSQRTNESVQEYSTAQFKLYKCTCAESDYTQYSSQCSRVACSCSRVFSSARITNARNACRKKLHAIFIAVLPSSLLAFASFFQCTHYKCSQCVQKETACNIHSSTPE